MTQVLPHLGVSGRWEERAHKGGAAVAAAGFGGRPAAALLEHRLKRQRGHSTGVQHAAHKAAAQLAAAAQAGSPATPEQAV